MLANLNLEEKIGKDNAGLFTAAVIKDFQQESRKLKRVLDRALPSDQAKIYEAGVKSFLMAANFLEEYWENQQNDNSDASHHDID